jgi:hypothetical protein
MQAELIRARSMACTWELLPLVQSVEDSLVSCNFCSLEQNASLQAELIRARGIACARELLLVQSVEDGGTEEIFAAIDADGNGTVDVRELTHALARCVATNMFNID